MTLEFRLSHISRVTNISGFGGRIAISGCRPLLQLLPFLGAFYVRKPQNLNAGSHGFRDISISDFGSHFLLSVNWEHLATLFSSSLWSKTPDLPLEF